MKGKNILIVEDEVLIAAQIKLYITRKGYHCVGMATNYKKSMEILERQAVDLVLLDINILGDKSGIDIARQLNENYQIPFIYLTSYTDDETIKELVETSPMAYLNKPVSEVGLNTTLDIAFKQIKQQNGQPHRIMIGKTQHQLVPDEIDYILADHVYVELHMGGNKKTLRSSLTKFLEKFPANKFIRINRSTAINPMKIKELNGRKVKIGDQVFAISSSYMEQLVDVLNISEQKDGDS
ncbi:response regulator [Nonlabens xiamenensis]|uniref:response regulator n=1 Tax=Nonlabens xiamenensis TaxID=2341043 RepID=UPI000F6134A8|nr:response regulator [Nonlabens xiamenensis]